MFFEPRILTRKGELAAVWLAAHWERKLSKQQVNQADIVFITQKIAKPDAALALRLCGHLLLGVTRIYAKKTAYLYTDCSEALIKIKMAFRPGMNLDLDEGTATLHALNLRDVPDFELDLAEPATLDIDTQLGADGNDIDLNQYRIQNQRELDIFGTDIPVPGAGDEEKEASSSEDLKRDASHDGMLVESYGTIDGADHPVIGDIGDDGMNDGYDAGLPMIPAEQLPEDASKSRSDEFSEGPVQLEDLEPVGKKVTKKRSRPMDDAEIMLSNDTIRGWRDSTNTIVRDLVPAPQIKRSKFMEWPEAIQKVFNRIKYLEPESSDDTARGADGSRSIGTSFVEPEAVIGDWDGDGGVDAGPIVPEAPSESVGEGIEESEIIHPIRSPTDTPSKKAQQMHLSHRSYRTTESINKEPTVFTFDSFARKHCDKNVNKVAIAFAEMLLMKSKDLVDVRQTVPYGDITITKNAKVIEKYLTIVRESEADK